MWQSLAAELRQANDISRIKELVILLEEAIFNRQQELAVNAEKLGTDHIKREEQEMREVLELMLEIKIKKLGFPDPWAKAA